MKHHARPLTFTLAALAAGLVSTRVLAWECEYERQFEETLSLSGSDVLFIVAGAGDLDIRGDSGGNEARVRGKVCASKEEWVNEATMKMTRGEQAEIAVVIPDVDWNWSAGGNGRYVYIDLNIDVPSDIELNVKDSSGDLKAYRTGPISVKDSSGDIDLDDIQGSVFVEDSSGDIELIDINGDVTIGHDSSGDMYGRGIQGSVLVAKDSSGDIRFKDVRDDFTVERDSSGDIEADGAGRALGSFLSRAFCLFAGAFLRLACGLRLLAGAALLLKLAQLGFALCLALLRAGERL